MSASCPSGDLDSIAALLSGIDCQVASYVEAAYRGLYGPFGWLGPVLTAALTIYVAIYAYQLITGYGRLSVSGLTRRFLAVGVVVALSSNWAAYQTAVAAMLSGGGDEIASALLRATGAGEGADVGVRLDAAFATLADLAANWGKGAPLTPAAAAPVVPITAAPPGPGASSAVNVLWFSALALALGSAGVIVIAKIVLGFLLALGPVFILLALFPATRGLFEGWLRTAAANALIPLFAMAAAAAMLPIVEPMIATIASNEARGVADAKPVFVLSIAALIFGALMFQIVAMTTRLAGAWRLPEAPRRDDGAAAQPAQAQAAAFGAAADPRIVAMVAAVSRDSGGAEFASRPRADVLVVSPHETGRDSGEARRVAGAYRGFGAAARAKGSAA